MSPAEEPIADPKDSAQGTILVVEDEVLVRLSIAESLRDHGFTVIEAASGDEALTVLTAGLPVDLVFSDIHMPGRMDGVALAQWAASHYSYATVVLTSGVSSSLTLAQAAAPLVRAFIPKPYDHELLGIRFKTLLEQRARR